MSKSFDKAKVGIYTEVRLTELADSFVDYVNDVNEEDFAELVKRVFAFVPYDESPAMQDIYKFLKTAKKEAKA